MKKQIFALAILAAIATPAMADNTGRFYIAGDLGNVSFSNSIPASFGIGALPNPGGFRIAGGYHFSPMLAVEAGYTMLGDSTISFTGGSVTAKNSALQIAAVGTYPVASAFDLIGKLGMSMNSNKLTGTGAASVVNSSNSSTALMYGIGAQYHVNQQVSIRAQYENFGNFKTNDGPVAPVTSWDIGTSMVSVGATYDF